MKLNRIRDPEKVRAAIALYPYEPIDLDVENWTRYEPNITLEAEDGSIALFEHVRPGFYDGHYFFKAKGREAISLSHAVIEELYKNYGVKVIRGFTPIKHKAALWMSRHIGFKAMDVVETEIGPCVLFVMNLDTHFSSIRDANA